MPYIKRNDKNQVVAISQSSAEGFSEFLSEDDPATIAFIESLSGDQARMQQTDLEFVRVLEDLIDVLVTKNYILYTDLPEVAQEKMRERQALRGKLTSHLELLADDDDEIFY